MKTVKRYIAMVGVLWLIGCAAGVNQDIVSVQTFPGFNKYKKVRNVAIVPFAKHHVPHGKKVIMGVPHKVTEDNGKVMCDIFTAELKKKVRFKIIRPEKVAEFFKKRKEEEPVFGILGAGEVKRVGELLNVDSLIMGRVDEFSAYQYRMYDNSKIALTVRMADAATGDLIWKGYFKLDQEGKPHEVAKWGVHLLLEQLMGRWGYGREKEKGKRPRGGRRSGSPLSVR